MDLTGLRYNEKGPRRSGSPFVLRRSRGSARPAAGTPTSGGRLHLLGHGGLQIVTLVPELLEEPGALHLATESAERAFHRIGLVQNDFDHRFLRSVATALAGGADDVLRGRALLALHDLELDLLTLGEGPETLALDRGVMHEAILRATLGGDEAKPLGLVEPLHGTGGLHCPAP